LRVWPLLGLTHPFGPDLLPQLPLRCRSVSRAEDWVTPTQSACYPTSSFRASHQLVKDQSTSAVSAVAYGLAVT